MIKKIMTKALLLGAVLGAVTVVPNIGHSRPIPTNGLNLNGLMNGMLNGVTRNAPVALNAVLQGMAAKPLAGK